MYRASREKTRRHPNDEQYKRKHQLGADKAGLACLAGKRRGKEIKLNRLSSISGGGGSGKLEIECYSCGEKGHTKRDCLGKGKRKNDDSHSMAAKRSKSSLDL